MLGLELLSFLLGSNVRRVLGLLVWLLLRVFFLGANSRCRVFSLQLEVLVLLVFFVLFIFLVI